MSDPVWVGVTPGVPSVADFMSTGAAGTPIIINQATKAAYYLGTANTVTAIATPSGGGASVVGMKSLNDFLATGRTPFVTDDTAAFSAAESYGLANGVIIVIPGGKYNLPGGFNFHAGITWLGVGSGQLGNSVAPSLIRVGKNVNGFVLNKDNTNGDGLGTQGDASGIAIFGVEIYGGNVNVNASGAITTYGAGDSPTGHGVRVRGTFQYLQDVVAAFFGGDGFNINCSAGSGGVAEGNANNFMLKRCESIYNGGFAYLTNGTDSNAGTFDTCSGISCAGGGIAEYSFLGNSYWQIHIRDCGMSDVTNCGRPTGTCVRGTTHYYVIAGKQVAASTSDPATDGGVNWRVWGGNSSDKTWVTGLTWSTTGGAPYATNPSNLNNRSVFNGCYGEGSQPRIQAFAPALFLGGLLTEVGWDIGSTAVWLNAEHSSSGGSAYSIRNIASFMPDGTTVTPLTVAAINRTWDPTTPGNLPGALHLDWNQTNGQGPSFTVGGGGNNAGVGGLYSLVSSAYGMRMYLATTDNFGLGAKTAIGIDELGNVNLPRGTLTLAAGKTITVGSAALYDASGNLNPANNLTLAAAKTITVGGATLYDATGNLNPAGNLALATGNVVSVAGTQVVTARQTGWTASTGTPARGVFAATAAPTVSAAYVQTEAQGIANRTAALEARLIAMEADMRAHGLIN